MSRLNTQAAATVYPRVCGGTYGVQAAVSIAHGLSPRVRGNRPPRTSLPAGEGSIPACAGEPFLQSDAINASEVYPRVCGGTKVSSRLAK